VILRFHFTSPAELLHPSSTQHIKISHAFFIYVPNFTLLCISYYLLSNLSQHFQKYAQYGTDQSKILKHSVHIPAPFAGGHYPRHVIPLQAKTALYGV
jgi:hypothetical protein